MGQLTAVGMYPIDAVVATVLEVDPIDPRLLFALLLVVQDVVQMQNIMT